MTHALSPSAIKQTLEGLGGQVNSVLLARPSIETGGEKLRLVAKNAVQALEEAGAKSDALRQRLESLTLEDVQSPGLALYESGGEVRELRLTTPPRAMVKAGGQALWLPAVADACNYQSAWVAVADRNAPRLYKLVDDRLHDFSGIVELPDFSSIEARRQPQVDTLFHSSSSARATPGHGGHAKFHALGTSQEAEQEKTEEVFNREFAHALLEGLPKTAPLVFLAGDPQRIGHIDTYLRDATFEVVQVQSAGDALEESRLAEEVSARLLSRRKAEGYHAIGEIAPSQRIAYDELTEAGEMGRVETVWLSGEAAGLREYPEDEHFDFDDETRMKGVLDLQRRLTPALSHGAQLRLLPSLEQDQGPAFATARYDLAKGA